MSQVPFEFAVKDVLEQLTKIAKGGYQTPDTGKRKFGSIVYAAVSLPVIEIKGLLDNVSEELHLFLLLFTCDITHRTCSHFLYLYIKPNWSNLLHLCMPNLIKQLSSIKFSGNCEFYLPRQCGSPDLHGSVNS